MALYNSIGSPLLGNLGSSPVPVSAGGSGAASLTGVLIGNGTSPFTATAQLGVAQGGTGASTLTNHGLLVGAGTGAVSGLAAGTNGQVVVGSTNANPVFATLGSSDGSISYTLGAGTLSLQVTNPGMPATTWTFVTGSAGSAAANPNTGQSMQTNTAYTFTMAEASGVGALYKFANRTGTGFFTVVPPTGGTIYVGSTAVSASGSIASSAQGDRLTLECIDATPGAQVYLAMDTDGGSFTLTA